MACDAGFDDIPPPEAEPVKSDPRGLYLLKHQAVTLSKRGPDVVISCLDGGDALAVFEWLEELSCGVSIPVPLPDQKK